MEDYRVYQAAVDGAESITDLDSFNDVVGQLMCERYDVILTDEELEAYFGRYGIA